MCKNLVRRGSEVFSNFINQAFSSFLLGEAFKTKLTSYLVGILYLLLGIRYTVDALLFDFQGDFNFHRISEPIE